MLKNNQPKLRIELWSVVSPLSSPYTPPECTIQQLHGRVYNHPRFLNGELVTTSEIIGVRNGKVITISGSVYELGEPHSEYEEQFPNAKKRLLDMEHK